MSGTSSISSNINVSTAHTGNTSSQPQEITINKHQILEHQGFGTNLALNLGNITKPRTVEVTTHGMEGKNWYQKIGQFFSNLGHNIAMCFYGSTRRDEAIDKIHTNTKKLYNDLGKNCTKITPKLCGKIIQSTSPEKALAAFKNMVKTLQNYANQLATERDKFSPKTPGTPDGNYEKLSEAKQMLMDIKVAFTINLKQYYWQQFEKSLSDIEGKILKQFENGTFSPDDEAFKILDQLNYKDLSDDKFFSDVGDIQTKYNQLCTLKDAFKALKDLKNVEKLENVKKENKPSMIFSIWCKAKNDLQKYGGNSQTAASLEQRLDEIYTEKIKATSKDIKTILDNLKNGKNVDSQMVSKARFLCSVPSTKYKAEGLSTYIGDLEKGIEISNKLTKLRTTLSILKKSSVYNKTIDQQSNEIATQAEKLHTQLKQISDDEIAEVLGKRLLEAVDELQNIQNRAHIQKDLKGKSTA